MSIFAQFRAIKISCKHAVAESDGGKIHMYNLERQQDILTLLKTRKSISVTELSRAFFASEATIRRDLSRLEKVGLVKRTHGGVMLLEGADMEIPLAIRETEHHGEKQYIGRLASREVKDGDTIILDSSSTALHMTPHLKARKDLTVITNGARTAIELGQHLDLRVLCSGGWLRENSLSYVGGVAMRTLSDYRVRTLFFACRAVSMENGLSDPNEEEASLRRAMISRSDRVILLCDSSKFDKSSFCVVCDFNAIHCLITDRQPDPAWMEFLTGHHVSVIYH